MEAINRYKIQEIDVNPPSLMYFNLLMRNVRYLAQEVSPGGRGESHQLGAAVPWEDQGGAVTAGGSDAAA